jgi:hypothetical protein
MLQGGTFTLLPGQDLPVNAAALLILCEQAISCVLSQVSLQPLHS